MTRNIASSFDFYQIFRTSVTSLTQLNEAFGCFNPWIVTPNSNQNSSNGVVPLATTVAYALLEPLATRYLIYVAIRPWILLLALSPFHLYWAWLSMEAFDWLDSIRNAVPRSQRAVPSSIDKVSPSIILTSEKKCPEKIYVTIALIVPVFTAALINATLLLFTQSLYATSLLERNPLILYLAPFTVIINLICRLGDCIMWSRTQRGRFPNQIGYSDFIGALIYQAALFTIRACMRMAIGLAPLMVFETPTPFQAEENFGSEQYLWLEQLRLPSFAHKLQLAFALGSPLLMLLGGYLMIRSLKEDSFVGSEKQ